MTVYDNNPSVWPPPGWKYVDNRWTRFCERLIRRSGFFPLERIDAPTTGLRFVCPAHGEVSKVYSTRAPLAQPPLDLWVHRRCGQHCAASPQ